MISKSAVGHSNGQKGKEAKVEQEKRRWTTKSNLSYFLSFQGSLTSLRCLIALLPRA